MRFACQSCDVQKGGGTRDRYVRDCARLEWRCAACSELERCGLGIRGAESRFGARVRQDVAKTGERSTVRCPPTLLLALLVMSTSMACDRHKSVAGATSSSAMPVQAPAPPLRRRVAGHVAFDLVLQREGALLIYADKRGRVVSQPLDAGGRAVGTERTVAKKVGTVLELAVEATGSNLAIGWVSDTGDGARARLVRGAASGSFDDVLDFGTVDGRAREQRGLAAVTRTQNGEVLFMHRGEDRPCEDGDDANCGSFHMRRVKDRSATPRGELSVPSECGITALRVIGDRWQYGVCSAASGEPVTRMFTIHFPTSYAHVTSVLPGCRGLGSIVIGQTLWVIGKCGDKRRAVRLGAGEGSSTVDVSDLKLDCTQSLPVLKSRELTLPLREPRADLAALLPVERSGLGARAVWTGARLLIARVRAGNLEMRRYKCASGVLVSG